MTKAPAKAAAKAKKRDARLDPPTDLGLNAVGDISAALNLLLADVFALYLKTKNFHWHVSGPNFRDYHKLLDEQAEDIFDSIDPLAERVRKLGAKTLRSLDEILRMKSLDENSADFVPPSAMITELLEDNRAMAEAMRKAHKVCDEAEDVASASLLENYSDATDKRIWFLIETSRSAAAAHSDFGGGARTSSHATGRVERRINSLS